MSLLEDLCRLCAKKLNLSFSKNIFEMENRHLVFKILKCLPIRVSANDSYPKHVCSDCAYQLDVSFALHGKCLTAIQVFEDIVIAEDAQREKSENELLEVKEETMEINLSPEEISFAAANDAAHGMISIEEPEFKFSLTEHTSISGEDRSDNDISGNLFWCENCAEGFKTNPELQKHYRKIHFQPKTSRPRPQKSSEENIPVPALTAEKTTEEECNECKKKFSRSENSPTDPSRCEDCRRYFFTHMFACDKCPKRFLNEGAHSKHMKNHLHKKSFACLECPMQFFRKGELSSHMRKHTVEKHPDVITQTMAEPSTGESSDDARPSICDACKKSFTSRGIHNSQIENRCEECARHFFIYTFGCPDCPKRFINDVSLQTHMRKHTGEKPYLCQECGKSFRTAGQLRFHMDPHIGDQRYECEKCLKRFKYSGCLRWHIYENSHQT